MPGSGPQESCVERTVPRGHRRRHRGAGHEVAVAGRPIVAPDVHDEAHRARGDSRRRHDGEPRATGWPRAGRREDTSARLVGIDDPQRIRGAQGGGPLELPDVRGPRHGDDRPGVDRRVDGRPGSRRRRGGDPTAYRPPERVQLVVHRCASRSRWRRCRAVLAPHGPTPVRSPAATPGRPSGIDPPRVATCARRRRRGTAGPGRAPAVVASPRRPRASPRRGRRASRSRPGSPPTGTRRSRRAGRPRSPGRRRDGRGRRRAGRARGPPCGPTSRPSTTRCG